MTKSFSWNWNFDSLSKCPDKMGGKPNKRSWQTVFWLLLWKNRNKFSEINILSDWYVYIKVCICSQAVSKSCTEILIPTNWQLITSQIEVTHYHLKWFRQHHILNHSYKWKKGTVIYGKRMIGWKIKVICSPRIYLSWWHHFVITWHFFLDRFWNLQLISIFSNSNKRNL